jgi:hypothetical protein
MRTLRKVLNYVRFAKTSKLVLGSLFVLALTGAVATQVISDQQSVQAATNGNDIIAGGVSSKSDFVAEYKKNTTKDLPAIYTHYGMSSSELSRFGSTAVEGIAYKNGDIKVNGKTVATDARSLGRHKKSGDHAITIGGKTYYEGSNSTAFASNSLAVIVMMDANGQFEFAVIKDCGNPITGKVVKPAPKPAYACTSLTAAPISNSRTNYNFTAKASASNGAKITRYVIAFGDGKTKEVTSSNTSVTTPYNYSKPGTYNATLTVHFTVNGKDVTDNGGNCKTTVTVKPVPVTPAFVCTNLSFSPLQQKNQYRFTATADPTGGAVLVSADFNFDDGQTAKGIKPAAGSNQVVVDHTYAAAKDYTITATVYSNVTGAAKSATCQVQIKVNPEFCKPNIPVGDIRCQEVLGETVSVIPSTGPAEMIGGAMGASSITGAGYYWLRSRRELISKLLGR